MSPEPDTECYHGLPPDSGAWTLVGRAWPDPGRSLSATPTPKENRREFRTITCCSLATAPVTTTGRIAVAAVVPLLHAFLDLKRLPSCVVASLAVVTPYTIVTHRHPAHVVDAAAGEKLVRDWLIECAKASELLAHVRGDRRSIG